MSTRRTKTPGFTIPRAWAARMSCTSCTTSIIPSGTAAFRKIRRSRGQCGSGRARSSGWAILRWWRAWLAWRRTTSVSDLRKRKRNRQRPRNERSDRDWQDACVRRNRALYVSRTGDALAHRSDVSLLPLNWARILLAALVLARGGAGRRPDVALLASDRWDRVPHGNHVDEQPLASRHGDHRSGQALAGPDRELHH